MDGWVARGRGDAAGRALCGRDERGLAPAGAVVPHGEQGRDVQDDAAGAVRRSDEGKAGGEGGGAHAACSAAASDIRYPGRECCSVG